MRRRARVLAIVCVVAACAVACNAVLGITDVPASLDAGGVGPGDATAHDAGHVSTETHPPDAAAEATIDATTDAPEDVTQVPDDASAPDVATVCETTSDMHNCGHCGHDCLGGQCMMGVCQAFPLFASDAGANPYDLAQDGTFLYWPDLENGTLYRTSKSTGETTVVYQTPERFGGDIAVDGVAVDDAGLYWGDDMGIWRCSKTSCSTPTLAATSPGSGIAFRLAIDDQGVYWDENSTKVFAAHKYGTGETPSVLWQSDASASANTVATDGQRVYFTASDGFLHGIGVDGGGPFALSTLGDASTYGLSLYQGEVYWSATNGSQGTVSDAPTASLRAGVVGVTPPGVSDVASDGTLAYWVSGTAQIMVCDVANCSPTAIAQGTFPGKLIIDAVAVYWADSTSLYYGGGGGNGSVWKIAR
ncbi:MAG: hypothetical protein ACLP1X_13220 [Polyangiaceae bacterium]